MTAVDDAVRESLESLEAPPELLPYLDELLCDLPDLGTDPTEVIPLLRTHGVAPGARAVDLGCGSGIVSVALARELGCLVDGVDAYPRFIERAVRRAESADVAERCRFRAGDLRELLGERGLDLAVYGSIGAVLGSLEQTVRRLREVLRPGGLLLLDHAYARTPEAASPGYPTLEVARKALAACGDAVLHESAVDLARVKATNARNHRLLAARAEAISRRVPEVAPALAAYLSRQDFEERNLEHSIAPVLWLLEKAA